MSVMKKLCLISLVVLCVFQLSARKQAVPEWVSDYKSVYPDSKYIAQKGSGKSSTEAKNDAAANLSFYFNTNVNAVRETNSKNYKITAGRKKKQTEVTNIIEQSFLSETVLDTDTVLTGLEFTEPWQDRKSKTWYCLAFIERETLWKLYDVELSFARDGFKGLYESAEKAGEPFEKIRMLSNVYEKGREFLDKLSYAQFLSEKLTERKYKDDVILLSNLTTVQQNEKNNSPLFVHVKADSTSTLYSTVTQVLEEEGFTVLKDKNRALYTVEVTPVFDYQNDDDVLVYSPSVTVDFMNKAGSVYVYSKSCEKIKVYTEALGIKKSIQKIDEELKLSLREIWI